MNMSDAIICHNPTMNKWLCDNGFKGYNGKGILVTLNVFDFLSDSQCTDKQKDGLHTVLHTPDNLHL